MSITELIQNLQWLFLRLLIARVFPHQTTRINDFLFQGRSCGVSCTVTPILRLSPTHHQGPTHRQIPAGSRSSSEVVPRWALASILHRPRHAHTRFDGTMNCVSETWKTCRTAPPTPRGPRCAHRSREACTPTYCAKGNSPELKCPPSQALLIASTRSELMRDLKT